MVPEVECDVAQGSGVECDVVRHTVRRELLERGEVLDAEVDRSDVQHMARDVRLRHGGARAVVAVECDVVLDKARDGQNGEVLDGEVLPVVHNRERNDPECSEVLHVKSGDALVDTAADGEAILHGKGLGDDAASPVADTD